MAEANAVTPPLQTAAAAPEKAKLRNVLSRIDLVLFTACAILGLLGVAFWAIGARNVRRGLLAPAAVAKRNCVDPVWRTGSLMAEPES